MSKTVPLYENVYIIRGLNKFLKELLYFLRKFVKFSKLARTHDKVVDILFHKKGIEILRCMGHTCILSLNLLEADSVKLKYFPLNMNIHFSLKQNIEI